MIYNSALHLSAPRVLSVVSALGFGFVKEWFLNELKGQGTLPFYLKCDWVS